MLAAGMSFRGSMGSTLGELITTNELAGAWKLMAAAAPRPPDTRIDVESVTDESGTEHRVFAVINGIRLSSDWTSDNSRAERAADSLRTLLATTPKPADEVRCKGCDGTGDVHNAEGMWLGTCFCRPTSGAAVKAEPPTNQMIVVRLRELECLERIQHEPDTDSTWELTLSQLRKLLEQKTAQTCTDERMCSPCFSGQGQCETGSPQPPTAEGQTKQGRAADGVVSDGELWNLRRQAKDDPRCAEQQWFIIFAHLVIERFCRTQPVPGWKLVPLLPTPAMIAAATIAVLPDASAEDFELARAAARIVLAHPDAPEGVSLEAIASAMATIIPAHKAMLAASPSALPDAGLDSQKDVLGVASSPRTTSGWPGC
jgi:hypothetical protein